MDSLIISKGFLLSSSHLKCILFEKLCKMFGDLNKIWDEPLDEVDIDKK
jgi:hypothetical protein